MKYQKEVILKDGRSCILRNGTAPDAQAVRDNFILTHGQTDFLTTYPEEISFTVDREKEYLTKKTESSREVALVAEVDGEIVGTAGVDSIGAAEKLRHRASFGISIDKAWWGLGIGRALTEACIECAGAAGYVQLELEVVAANKWAVAMYQHAGFSEYGRNPGGFRSRISGMQEIILMRRILDEQTSRPSDRF